MSAMWAVGATKADHAQLEEEAGHLGQGAAG